MSDNSGQYFGTGWCFILECWNTNQISDGSIDCIFNTRMSRVSKINLTSTPSRLLLVHPLIQSHVKSYWKGQRKKPIVCCDYCLHDLNQTRCLVSLPMLVVSRCDLEAMLSYNLVFKRSTYKYFLCTNHQSHDEYVIAHQNISLCCQTLLHVVDAAGNE